MDQLKKGKSDQKDIGSLSQLEKTRNMIEPSITGDLIQKEESKNENVDF